MRFRFVFLYLFFSFAAAAQEEIPIRELIENMADVLPEDYDFEEWSEQLTYYKKHPLNLNIAKREELQNLWLLSPLQIAGIFRHIAQHGKFIDVLELHAVAGFDAITVQKLLPFVKVSEDVALERPDIKNLFGSGEHDLLLRYGRTLEKQKGYAPASGSHYTGTPDKLLFRYKYHFQQKIFMAWVMEKDAGEPLKPAPMDFTSLSLAIADAGIFKKIVIGDYNLQFGQGLNLWSGFSFGKSPDVAGMVKAESGLKPYASANEYSFFRGTAFKLQVLKHVTVYPFWSFRKHDASISMQNGTEVLNTLNQSGYHRTPTEIANEKRITQHSYGLAGGYSSGPFTWGTSIYRIHFNKMFIPGPQPYQQFNFKGTSLLNTGFHYNYTYKNTHFYGEIAKSNPGGIAWMQGILLSLSRELSASLFYRDYAKDYHNFFSQPPAEGNGFNENGIYTGVTIQPSKKWKISCYADFFKFPWLKFRADAPSEGYELFSFLQYTPDKSLSITLRFKQQSKQENTDQEIPLRSLDEVRKGSYRVELNWKINRSLTWQSRAERVLFRKGNEPAERGSLIAQDLYLKTGRYAANIRFAYFYSHSYNSRIYAYENDVLYHYGFGLYSGHGLRTYANIKLGLWKHADVWLRYALFHYKNVSTTGSGLDEIQGNKKSEVKIQFRYQF